MNQARSVALVALAAFSLLPPAVAQPRPNVVLIIMDDLGYGDIGSYGVPDAKTPNLDRLAREGTRLTDFYANAANCSPTRTALISGRYQQRYGIEQPILTGNTETGLLPSENSLPRLLKTAGYSTGLVGKWHVGTGPQFRPGRHGFEEFWGFLGSTADYYRHGWAAVDAAGRIDPEKLTSALFHNDEPVTYDGYLTDGITLNARRFLEAQSRAAPFFLQVAYNAPHFPFQGPNLPPGQRDRLEPLREGTRAEYVAMVEHADRGIGEILSLLDARKLAANTIVIFTSDNGGEWLSRNAPFFNRKSSIWEGGIRVPLLVRWPGHLRPGSVSRQVGMTMDLTASIIAAAGVTPPVSYRPEGIDLFPLLQKGATIDRTLFWRVNANGFVQKAVRRGSFKFLQEGSGTVEGYHEFLFDLTADPGERHDLSQTQPARVRELRQLVAAWDADVTAEFRQR
jgi:arylsulfatase A-like enzyme